MLWYHDHTMDYTAPQVYRGLFGVHIIRDDEEDRLPLPAGDREIPLVIADRAFDDNGAFLYPVPRTASASNRSTWKASSVM